MTTFESIMNQIKAKASKLGVATAALKTKIVDIADFELD